MKSAFKSDKQKELFEVLSRCGELIFACGKEGVSANIVGEFIVKRYDNDEDRLDMGDGTNHVHIDWNKITKVEMGSFHGEGHEEGMLTFFNNDEPLFKLYRPQGEYPQEVKNLVGALL